jgi:hypothetical protein
VNRRPLVSAFSVFFCALATAGAVGCNLGGGSPTSAQSSDVSNVPFTPQPPCADAVLHGQSETPQCSASGVLVDVAEDDWCCPDGTTPTTQTVIDTTDTPCTPPGGIGGDGGTNDDDGGSTAMVACGKVGSGCDSTVCTGNARCTTKYGGCMCATLAQENCTIKGSACVDNGCTNLGGTCAVYTNGNDTGCVCGK